MFQEMFRSGRTWPEGSKWRGDIRILLIGDVSGDARDASDAGLPHYDLVFGCCRLVVLMRSL